MKAPGLAAVAIGIAASFPAPAGAERVVDYTIDEATAAQNAIEQGVSLAPLPKRGRVHVAVQIDPAVDHQVVRAGISCSGWTVQNPASVIIQRFLTAWDRESAPASSFAPDVDILVSLNRAATFSRCVGTGELKSTCITRVSIDGTSMRKGGIAQPFHIEREESTKGVGACAGLTRGIGLVTREAASSLVTQLTSVASTTISPSPT